MNNIVDALIYTSIKNNIDIAASDQRFFFLKKNSGVNDSDNNIALNNINKIMENTTIKRACCMAKRDKSKIDVNNNINVQVKIPIPTGGESSSDKIGTKFGYRNIQVKIPSNMCTKPEIFGENYNTSDASDKGNPACDKFMGAYCNNMKYLYLKENGSKPFDANEFYEYSPECPCYADLPPWTVQQNSASTSGLSRNCVLTNCEITDPNVYLDPSSREPCKSNITFCTEYNNWKSITASQGGTINIDKKTTQNCSSSDSKNATQPDGTGESGDSAGSDGPNKSDNTKSTTDNTKSKISEESSNNSSNTTLYIGIGVGLLLLIIGVALFIIIKKNKNITGTTQSVSKDG